MRLAHRSCRTGSGKRQYDPLLGQPADDVAPSVMARLVHLITRRPSSFLVPLVDGVKGNIEQYRNLISREASLGLSTGLFAKLGRSLGAIPVGGQFGSGQDHITGIGRSYASATPSGSPRYSSSPTCGAATVGQLCPARRRARRTVLALGAVTVPRRHHRCAEWRKASCAIWTHDLTRFHDYLAESKVTERLKVQGLSG